MTNSDAATSHNSFRLIIYAKNITDNTAEQVAVDTDCTYPGINFGCELTINPKIPNELMIDMVANNFRGQNFPNQCFGWRGLSHMMFAGWTTDAGQRIGAAAEIETGGSADTTPPAAPTGLRISSLWRWLASLFTG